MKNLLENMRNDVDENSNSPGKWTYKSRRYREKGSIFRPKIENSWFSPKNTGDLESISLDCPKTRFQRAIFF